MKDSIETYYVITANRLRDGAVVYLSKSGDKPEWSTDIRRAEVFAEDDKVAAEENAAVSEKANLVVGIYAFEIADKNQPLGAREIIRASGGPTIQFGNDVAPMRDPDYTI